MTASSRRCASLIAGQARNTAYEIIGVRRLGWPKLDRKDRVEDSET